MQPSVQVSLDPETCSVQQTPAEGFKLGALKIVGIALASAFIGILIWTFAALALLTYALGGLYPCGPLTREEWNSILARIKADKLKDSETTALSENEKFRKAVRSLYRHQSDSFWALCDVLRKMPSGMRIVIGVIFALVIVAAVTITVVVLKCNRHDVIVVEVSDNLPSEGQKSLTTGSQNNMVRTEGNK